MSSLYRVTLFSVALASLVLVSGLFATHSAAAATMTLTADEPNNRYYELRAKVEYLKAFVAALRESEWSPEPTFIVVLDGDVVSVVGTLARDPQPDLVEICGPMQKGTIDWGDGTIEKIMGLGCSGNAHAFTVQHEYEESASYKLRVTDSADRDQTHVVAVNVE